MQSKRNLRAEFQDLTTAEVKISLDARRRPFATLILNVKHELNMACVMRSHNAFCGQEFFYLGRKKYYKPGTVGVRHYEHITHLSTWEQALSEIPSKYTWVGLDNLPGATPLPEFEWPKNPLLVFGSEANGLDEYSELRYYCKHIVEIPQLGSVRSLNVACAASITMYDLCLQQGWLQSRERD